MPKMKTHRAAAKRFNLTGTGKVKRSHAFNRHKAEAKTAKRKRALGHPAILTHADERRVKRLIPYK